MLLLVALFAASYAGMIPLACLSGILIGVAARMAEWDTFPENLAWTQGGLRCADGGVHFDGDFDLTIGVGIGLMMAAGLFVKRMERN